MRCNEKGISLIKHFEGLRLSAYLDIGHIYTIGYGHAEKTLPGDTIDQAMADTLLKSDVETIETQLQPLLKNIPLTSNQYSALVCLVFNIGVGSFMGSTLLRLLPKDKTLAADEFLCWNHVHGQVQAGLTKRREAERELFLQKE